MHAATYHGREDIRVGEIADSRLDLDSPITNRGDLDGLLGGEPLADPESNQGKILVSLDR